MRIWTVVIALFCIGCSSDGPSSGWPSSGDSCTPEQLGFMTCGYTTGKVEAVLRCETVGVDTLWVAQHNCPEGCDKAACKSPSTDDINVPADQTQPGDAAGDASAPGDGLSGDGTGQGDLFQCEPGHTKCLSTTLLGTCNDAGDGYTEAPCPEGQGCEGGMCQAQSCTPGEKKGECFSSTEYLACNEGGTGWSAMACDAPQTCFEGECVSWSCNPGDTLCKGLSVVQECVEVEPGTWDLVEVEVCASGLCTDGACVSACDVNHKLNTYLGCNYWAVDLDNIEGGQLEAVGLVVSAPPDALDANVTITNNATGQVLSSVELGGAPLTVTGGELQVYQLPTDFGIDGSDHSARSFRVEADQPVTVHQFNPLVGANVFTNDASLLLPDYAGGTEYLVMSWKLRTWLSTLRGFFTVVATQEGTTSVTIKPTAGIIAGPGVPSLGAGQSQTFNLSQGDVLNLEVSGNQGADLTGTSIVADKKISVFGGHECANIHVEYERCDHIEQQLYPLAAWGSSYVADSFAQRTAGHVDTWRILAGEDGVAVTLDPPVAGPFNLNKGQWVEFDSAEPFYADGNGRFLLGHYLQSCNYPGYEVFCTDSAGELGIGDPAFTLAVPVDQYLDSYVFLTPSGYTQDFANIVFTSGAEVLLDGQPLTQTPVALGESGFVMVQEPLDAGTHTVEADSPVGVTAYGYGCHVSYAYPGGLKLEAL